MKRRCSSSTVPTRYHYQCFEILVDKCISDCIGEFGAFARGWGGFDQPWAVFDAMWDRCSTPFGIASAEARPASTKFELGAINCGLRWAQCGRSAGFGQISARFNPTWVVLRKLGPGSAKSEAKVHVQISLRRLPRQASEKSTIRRNQILAH